MSLVSTRSVRFKAAAALGSLQAKRNLACIMHAEAESQRTRPRAMAGDGSGAGGGSDGGDDERDVRDGVPVALAHPFEITPVALAVLEAQAMAHRGGRSALYRLGLLHLHGTAAHASTHASSVASFEVPEAAAPEPASSSSSSSLDAAVPSPPFSALASPATKLIAVGKAKELIAVPAAFNVAAVRGGGGDVLILLLCFLTTLILLLGASFMCRLPYA